MGAGVRPESRIERNVAALKAQGASEHDIEAYLTQHEGLQPSAQEPAPRDATASRLGSRPTPSKLGPSEIINGLAQTASQGGTFGFANDLAALAAGVVANPLHPLKNFGKLKKEATDKEAAFRSEYPVTAAGSEMAGALASGGLTGGVAGALRGGLPTAVKPVGTLAKLGALAKSTAGGAAAGGVAAFGSAPGDLSERAAAIPRGMGYGAGTVLGVKGAGAVIGATGIPKAVQNLLPRPQSSGSVPGRVFGAAGLSSAEDLAKADLLKQLERARLTLPELREKAAQALPDEMLLNVGGQPMVERAGGAVATPARGSADIVTALDRQNQRLPKLTRESASKSLGVQRENAVQTVEQLAQERSQGAEQAFGALRDHYATPQKIDALDKLVGRPSFDSAVKETENILRESPGGLKAPLIETVKEGEKEVRRVRPLSFDEAQVLKQAHDDVAKMATPMTSVESGGVTKTRIGKQKGTHGELMDALKGAFTGDEQAGVPSYEKALSGFADKSKLIEAHDAGQKFMQANTDELKALWPTLSEPEREFYRKGAIASIEDAVRGRTDGVNPTRPFLDEIMRDNLRVVMPDEQSAQAFQDAIERIHGMHTARQAITGNSKTAARLAQQAEAAGGLETVTNAVANPSSLLRGLLNNAATRRVQGLSENQVNALAPLLTAQGMDMQRVIAELQQMATKQASKSGRVVRSAGQVAGASSARP